MARPEMQFVHEYAYHAHTTVLVTLNHDVMSLAALVVFLAKKRKKCKKSFKTQLTC